MKIVIKKERRKNIKEGRKKRKEREREEEARSY
jgi:hypothetical protein